MYVVRLSADGAIAAILGTIHPDVFVAVGVHSGLPVGAAKDLVSARHRRLSSSTVTRPLSSTPLTGKQAAAADAGTAAATAELEQG